MQNYHIPLQPNGIYHIFSRAVGDEQLFLSHDNYFYFLRKFKEHIAPIGDMYTYSLLPNHFHLLVRIKEEQTIIEYFAAKKNRNFDTTKDNLCDFIMERFSNWLNGYTKAFNKMYQRKGALFMDYIKRAIVKQDSDFSNFVFYVHKNAVHHGLTKEIGTWLYDGYTALLSEAHTDLLRVELLNWFGGKEAFIQFHKQPIMMKNGDLLEVEPFQSIQTYKVFKTL
jgi:putative transposase